LCSPDEKQRGADCCAGTAGGMKGEIKRDRESREKVCGRGAGRRMRMRRRLSLRGRGRG